MEGKMSEYTAQELYRAIESLPTDEAFAAMRAMGVSFACAACGKGTHELVVEGANVTPVAAPIPPANKQAYWFLLTVCDSCGIARYYLAPVIAERVLDARKAGHE